MDLHRGGGAVGQWIYIGTVDLRRGGGAVDLHRGGGAVDLHRGGGFTQGRWCGGFTKCQEISQHICQINY